MMLKGVDDSDLAFGPNIIGHLFVGLEIKPRIRLGECG
jgi:hypothetical protein